MLAAPAVIFADEGFLERYTFNSLIAKFAFPVRKEIAFPVVVNGDGSVHEVTN